MLIPKITPYDTKIIPQILTNQYMTHYSTKQIRKMDIDQKRRVYDLESKGLCTIEQAQIYS